MEKQQRSQLDELRKKITRLEMSRRPDEGRSISSGIETLDHWLGGGFARGSLVEWFDECEGAAATALALLAAREACADGGALVVFDRRNEFYPVEAIRWGIAPERLIVVQVTDRTDVAWASVEVLRSSAVGALLAWPGRIDGRDFRRMQLAVEEGGGLGLLVRPKATRDDASWAETRLGVEALPSGEDLRRRLCLRLLRARGVGGEPELDVEIDETACCVYSTTRLADAAVAAHTARAS